MFYGMDSSATRMDGSERKRATASRRCIIVSTSYSVKWMFYGMDSKATRMAGRHCLAPLHEAWA